DASTWRQSRGAFHLKSARTPETSIGEKRAGPGGKSPPRFDLLKSSRPEAARSRRRMARQSDQIEDFLRTLPGFGAREAAAAAVVSGERNIFDKGKLGERPRNLKCAADTAPGDLMRGEAGDFLALEANPSRGRSQRAGDQVKGGALAGTVRADQSEDLAFTNFEGNLVDGQESSETFAKAIDRQH